MRVALHDSEIPLARALPSGERTVRLRKGDIVTIPFQEMNRAEETWGADGAAFRPERWLDEWERGEGEGNTEDFYGGAEGTATRQRAEGKRSGERREGGRRRLPGLWSNMMTFGNGNPVSGHRACIGYRFALSE